MSDIIKSEPKSESSDERPTIKTEPVNQSIQAPISDVKQEPISQSPSKEAPKTSQAASTAPPKRVFVPNLAVDRSKREVKQEVDKSKEEKAKQPRRPAQPNLGASRGRGRNQNVIQSHSIFEAGPAESTKRFANRDQTETSYTRVSGSSDRSSNREIKKEVEELFAKPKPEQNILIQDSKEDESPVYIRLKHEMKEEETNVLESQNQSKLKDEKLLKNIFAPEDDLEKLAERLVLFQLPENLQLYDLSEGKIGKIRIRKSGKIDMVINDEKLLNVSLSVSAPFLQDAVGVEVTEAVDNVETGKMCNLGHVMNRIVCSPKF